MTGRLRRIAAISAALVLGCLRASEPEVEAEVDRGDPGEALRGYFEAVERADCRALEALLAESAAREFAELGCARTLAEFEEHDASLVGVDAAAPDGRDASLYLVRATLREGERTRSIVVGVRWVGERWRVVRM